MDNAATGVAQMIRYGRQTSKQAKSIYRIQVVRSRATCYGIERYAEIFPTVYASSALAWKALRAMDLGDFMSANPVAYPA